MEPFIPVASLVELLVPPQNNLHSVPAATHVPFSKYQIDELTRQGYTEALARSLEKARDAFALRIWVVDNSSSMMAPDGHRIIQMPDGKIRLVDCTRWDEIIGTVNYHIRLASLIGAPSRFRLLNEQFGLSEVTAGYANILDSAAIDAEANLAIARMGFARPDGRTPLTEHIQRIFAEVNRMSLELESSGRRVVINIATDGLPTDTQGYCGHGQKQAFVDALRRLEGLPVWLVIRLCTDEDDVVDFYNRLDETLELSIDVLDDFNGEALEIYEVNPWLTYGLPLHRMREMGHHDRLFDIIDNQKFVKSQVADFCKLIYGEHIFDGIPDPSVDFKGFLDRLDSVQKGVAETWNPVKKKLRPWVSSSRLRKVFGGGFGRLFGSR